MGVFSPDENGGASAVEQAATLQRYADLAAAVRAPLDNESSPAEGRDGRRSKLLDKAYRALEDMESRTAKIAQDDKPRVYWVPDVTSRFEQVGDTDEARLTVTVELPVIVEGGEQ